MDQREDRFALTTSNTVIHFCHDHGQTLDAVNAVLVRRVRIGPMVY